jgi:hypothetical protein
MPSFSERYNFKPKKIIQIDDIDDESRVSLWNVFYKHFEKNRHGDTEFNFDRWSYFKLIWRDFLKRPGDKMPSDYDPFLVSLRVGFFEENRFYTSINEKYMWKWWKVYDFLEFVSENDTNPQRKREFQNDCNKVMEKESLGYRFIDNFITPITSKDQITEIENAILQSTKEVQIHIEQSLILLSNRENPDYRNSIKESISAVEAQCKLIAEDNTATLTKALDKIERSNQVKIHPYLKEAFQKIYSWTNDDEGIRHALKDAPTVDQEDAQFMLVACSAFINYLHVKKMKSD